MKRLQNTREQGARDHSGRWLAALLLVIGAAGLSVKAHAADNCSMVLQDYYNWAKGTEPGYYHEIGFHMTTNLNTGKFASWSVGRIDYKPPLIGIDFFFPARLVGEVQQTFSDRVWWHYPPGGGFPDGHPFDPHASDKLGISIRVHPSDPQKARVTLTFKSWGNGTMTIDATCDQGHIYGFKQYHQHGKGLFDITLTKEKGVIIR